MNIKTWRWLIEAAGLALVVGIIALTVALVGDEPVRGWGGLYLLIVMAAIVASWIMKGAMLHWVERREASRE
jgi:Na+/melibiose symporter-like transporter